MSGTGGAGFRNAILIAGPTASGKSALAVEIAERVGGTVVNADSMQVYSILDVLTARPDRADLARAPHALYGHVHPSTPYSTGGWMRDVIALRQEAPPASGPMVFVGGTGLYFRALTEGISRMPDIPADIRQRLRESLAQEGPGRMHEALSRVDAGAASVLRPTDGQRVVRALEVMEASGRSILEWQADKGEALIDAASARFIVLEPDRAALVARIDQRLDRMIAGGAMAEIAALAELALDPALPAMRAIGVPDLLDALSEKISVPEAVARAKIATRQYAKRQSTWFRHQLGPQWKRFSNSNNALSGLD